MNIEAHEYLVCLGASCLFCALGVLATFCIFNASWILGVFCSFFPYLCPYTNAQLTLSCLMSYLCLTHPRSFIYPSIFLLLRLSYLIKQNWIFSVQHVIHLRCPVIKFPEPHAQKLQRKEKYCSYSKFWVSTMKFEDGDGRAVRNSLLSSGFWTWTCSFYSSVVDIVDIVMVPSYGGWKCCFVR